MELSLNKGALPSQQDLNREATPHGEVLIITKDILAVCCTGCNGAFPINIAIEISEN